MASSNKRTEHRVRSNWVKRFIPGKRVAIILGSILLLLIAARIALPYVVKSYVNKSLNEIPGYRGHIAGVRIHLYRGAYEIVGPVLEKTSGKVPVPLFSARNVDLSIEWASILRRTNGRNQPKEC